VPELLSTTQLAFASLGPDAGLCLSHALVIAVPLRALIDGKTHTGAHGGREVSYAILMSVSYMRGVFPGVFPSYMRVPWRPCKTVDTHCKACIRCPDHSEASRWSCACFLCLGDL